MLNVTGLLCQYITAMIQDDLSISCYHLVCRYHRCGGKIYIFDTDGEINPTKAEGTTKRINWWTIRLLSALRLSPFV